jgi:hypothetical protein
MSRFRRIQAGYNVAILSGETPNMKTLFAGAAALFAAAALPLCAHAATAQVGGDWMFTLSVGGNNIPVPCHFDQADAALTGACGGGAMSNPSPITGTVTDQNLTVAYDATVGGQALHVVLTGAAAADGTLAGNFTAGEYSGTFTAAHGAPPAAVAPAAPAAPAAAPPAEHSGH